MQRDVIVDWSSRKIRWRRNYNLKI